MKFEKIEASTIIQAKGGSLPDDPIPTPLRTGPEGRLDATDMVDSLHI